VSNFSNIIPHPRVEPKPPKGHCAVNPTTIKSDRQNVYDPAAVFMRCTGWHGIMREALHEVAACSGSDAGVAAESSAW
jgi:hypothetical protein